MQSVKIEVVHPKREQSDQEVGVPHSDKELSVLDVQNITVVRSGRVIIKNIDLKINKGEFVGLVGPN